MNGTVCLKTIDHVLTRFDGNAAVQEVGALAGSFFNPGLQTFSHFSVLGEDQNFTAGLAASPENIKEGGSLAGVGSCCFGLEVLRRRIANLLHARDEPEYLSSASCLSVVSGWIGSGLCIELFELGHMFFENFAVKSRLFGSEIGELINRIAFGQIGNDGFVAL